MSRNKYPEQTVERILDASLKLFLQKGYEHTTIQDIVDELGDLSKGAIYHHFSSKEDIIEAVADKLYEEPNAKLFAVVQASNMTGLEKLRKLLTLNLTDANQETFLTIAPNILKNPRFLAQQVKSCVEEVAPLFLQPILEQGMADGSLTCKHPKEVAEVMAILANIWINPLIFSPTKEELKNRFILLKDLLDHWGIPVLDEQVLPLLEHYRKL